MASSNTVAAIVAALGYAEEFVAGQPVNIPIPAESYTVAISPALSVKVSEPGVTVTVQKA